MYEYKHEHMHITDVCLLLEISPGEVRKMCREGEIESKPKSEGSVNYWMPTEQFRNHPNWDEFLVKKEERRQRSIRLAEKMIELLSDEEESEIKLERNYGWVLKRFKNS